MPVFVLLCESETHSVTIEVVAHDETQARAIASRQNTAPIRGKVWQNGMTLCVVRQSSETQTGVIRIGWSGH